MKPTYDELVERVAQLEKNSFRINETKQKTEQQITSV